MWRSLRTRNEFNKVYGEGAKQVGEFLVLYLLSAESSARGVVASKKVGNAVQRNRAKRLLRDALTNCLINDARCVDAVQKRFFPGEDKGNRPGEKTRGLWAVAIARPRILTAKSAAVRSEMRRLLGTDT